MKVDKFLWFKKLTAFRKLIICLLLTAIAFFLSGLYGIDVLSRLMIGYITFSFTMIAVDWLIFFHTPYTQIRTQAKVEDSSRITIFGIILISALASLLAGKRCCF